MADRHWAEIEDFGILWGMRLLIFVHRYLGRFILPIFLYPVVTYYWLTNSRARASSREYLTRVAASAADADIQPDGWTVFRHFMHFAHSVLDRVAAWTGLLDRDKVVFPLRAEVEARLQRNQGVMMISAHMGCLEVCRALASLKDDIKLNVLVHTTNAARMNAVLEPLNSEHALELIEVSSVTPATTIELVNKINQGELVVMVGDRVPVSGADNTVTADFLGAPAQFALGPWILAHILKCPVYTLFCIRGETGYNIHCEFLTERVLLPRKNRTEKAIEYLGVYIERMERYCRATPLQWFNFYPYWVAQNLEQEQ